MKMNLRVPYFETGVKCYIYGQDEIDYAASCEKVSKKYDIDMIFISSYTNIQYLSEKFPSLYIFAPYMDNIRPGRGMGLVLPESLKAAGASGVVLNHSEKPISLAHINGCIARCRELGLLSFVCADSVEEAKAIAQLGPDIMNPEPSELIGTGQSVEIDYVTRSVNAVKGINPSIIIEIAAGISKPQDVYNYILAGSDGAGAASGILKSKNPEQTLDEMVYAVRRAIDDQKK